MTTKVIHEANLAEVNRLGDNSAEFTQTYFKAGVVLRLPGVINS